MSNAKLPSELCQPLPRRVKAKRSPVVFFGIATILAAIATVLITYPPYAQYRMDSSLSLYGIAVKGIALSLKVVKPTKHDDRTKYQVEYQFDAKDGSGNHAVHGVDFVTRDYFDTLSAHKDISVVYDSQDPAISKLRYDGMETFVPLHMSLTMSAVSAAAADLLVFAVLGLVPVLSSRQQRHLLETGGVAAAVIVEKQKYLTPRHVRAKVIYEFADSSGRTYRGFRMHLPIEILTGGRVADPEISAMLANPTVVYDRDNPSINMLYPFDMVEIAK